MIYLRYLVVAAGLMLIEINAAGIVNTQTSISTETQNAITNLREKKEDIEEQIKAYKEQLEKGNEKLKESIKLLKAAIEVKKDTLLALEKAVHYQSNSSRRNKK